MCQLLAVCANQAVDIHLSFREWRHRGSTNPHGYGFAFWHNGALEIVKAASSLRAARGSDTEAVAAARSRIFLAHVRFRSVGVQDGNNTHPFRGFIAGTTFAFAHNGTISAIQKRRLHTLRPEGETDSEHAFLWLLESLPQPGDASFAAKLVELANDVRSLGQFNFLMADGVTVWAFADNSLWALERTPPYGDTFVTLEDDGYSIKLGHAKGPDEWAVLVATKPLTNEPGWQCLQAGELVVLRDGRIQERLH